jgi:ABC-type phosphate transport system auxiliary subunit
MNKNIDISMNEQKDIIISVNEVQKLLIKNDNRVIKGEDIYNMLDFTIGDTYSYKALNEEGKDKNVLEFVRNLIKKITDQIVEIKDETVDAEMQTKLQKIEDKRMNSED